MSGHGGVAPDTSWSGRQTSAPKHKLPLEPFFETAVRVPGKTKSKDEPGTSRVRLLFDARPRSRFLPHLQKVQKPPTPSPSGRDVWSAPGRRGIVGSAVRLRPRDGKTRRKRCGRGAEPKDPTFRMVHRANGLRDGSHLATPRYFLWCFWLATEDFFAQR